MADKKFSKVETFIQLEKLQEKQSLRFKDLLTLYDCGFNLVSDVINDLENKSTRKPPPPLSESATLIISVRLRGTLQSIRLLVLRGYYFEANILERSFLEGLGLCMYLAANEADAIKWVHHEKIDVTSVKLFEYILYDKAGMCDKASTKAAASLYGMLCDFVHSNIPAVLSLFREINVDKHPEKEGFIPTMVIQTPSKIDREGIKGMIMLPAIMLLVLRLITDKLEDKERRIKEAEYLTKVAYLSKLLNKN